MVQTFIIDHRKFSADMKKLNLDLRVSSRKIVEEIADEITEEGISRVKEHSKTGQMASEEIYNTTEDGWTRKVHFGKSSHLDSGTLPHEISMDTANEMAHFYGKTPKQFFWMIKKHGTKGHPFIDDAIYDVYDRIDEILEKELSRVVR